MVGSCVPARLSEFLGVDLEGRPFPVFCLPPKHSVMMGVAFGTQSRTKAVVSGALGASSFRENLDAHHALRLSHNHLCQVPKTP